MGDPLGIKAYLAMGKLVALLILIGVVCYQSSQIHKWHKQADAQAAARVTDRLTYKAAQTEAQAKNLQTLARVKAEQERINETTSSNYRRDLDRLRAQPRTDQGFPGGSPAPPNGKAPGGAHADGVPNPPCDNLCASEIELRLLYLQNWILDQLKVNPNH